MPDAGPAWAQVQVGRADGGAVVPDGFVGLSMEWGSHVPQLFGDGQQLNPAFIQLVRNIGSGVFRLGGNSSDESCFSTDGGVGTLFCRTAITPGNVQAILGTSAGTGWPVILGLNLGIADAGAALSFVDGALAGSPGLGQVEALEIGNEPDLYTSHVIGTTADGGAITVRLADAGWSVSSYLPQLSAYVDALQADPTSSALPLAGPAACCAHAWRSDIAGIVDAVRAGSPARFSLATMHDYPLSGTSLLPDGGSAVSIDALLSPALVSTWESVFASFVAQGEDAGIPVRLAEANSVSGGGRTGVSDTAAAMLWGADFMLSAAQEGLAGVNLHGGGGSSYSPIAALTTAAGTTLAVRPLYYALVLVGQQAQGRRFVPCGLTAPDGGSGPNVRAYALESCATGCEVTVFLINKELQAQGALRVQVDGAARSGSLLILTAPSLTDTGPGVTLGGSQVDTSTGLWTPGAPVDQPIAADAQGGFTVSLPSASIAVLKVTR